MDLTFSQDAKPLDVFNKVSDYIGRNMRIIHTDTTRPWGGFLVIDEADIQVFIYHFFPNFDKTNIDNQKLSPKILIVAPGQRLSWQYHHRRSELWKVIGGSVGVIRSEDDKETNKDILQAGEQVEIRRAERHRLVGLQEWGIIAEIWYHTNPKQPSDEEDIVRVQDDYKRE